MFKYATLAIALSVLPTQGQDVYISGKKLESDVVIRGGKMYVPLRDLAKHLGWTFTSSDRWVSVEPRGASQIVLPITSAPGILPADEFKALAERAETCSVAVLEQCRAIDIASWGSSSNAGASLRYFRALLANIADLGPLVARESRTRPNTLFTANTALVLLDSISNLADLINQAQGDHPLSGIALAQVTRINELATDAVKLKGPIRRHDDAVRGWYADTYGDPH